MTRLTEIERGCLEGYCALLAERLGDPRDERTREFLDRIADEVRVVWPAA
jgi:hypothetical protein